MESAEKLTAAQRGLARMDSIKSACCGALAPVMIQDSAIIILFASLLGAGDMLSMVTTSTQGLANCLLLMPFAYLSSRFGHKRTIIHYTAVGVPMILLLAASPWCGAWGKTTLLVSIIIFSITNTAVAAAWFPLVDGFLLREERSSFFGLMRFSWQTFAVVFLLACGFALGKDPAVWMLQVIIAVSAAGLLCKVYYLNKIPNEHQERETIHFADGVSEAVSNKALCGFSVYICFLYLAAYSTPPLMFIYIKKVLLVGDNVIVIISSLALVGTILGFLLAGRIIERLGVKRMLLMIHFLFAAVNLVFFMMGGSSVAALALITALLAVYGFCTACSSIAISTETMSLSSSNNKAMSIAFCGSCHAAGIGGSRLLASLVLGSGMLAPEWLLGTMRISSYQTLFLLYGCAIMFVCLLLVLVPAIFPKGHYGYIE